MKSFPSFGSKLPPKRSRTCVPLIDFDLSPAVRGAIAVGPLEVRDGRMHRRHPEASVRSHDAQYDSVVDATHEHLFSGVRRPIVRRVHHLGQRSFDSTDFVVLDVCIHDDRSPNGGSKKNPSTRRMRWKNEAAHGDTSSAEEKGSSEPFPSERCCFIHLSLGLF